MYVIAFSSGEGDVKTSCIRISLICPVSDVLQIFNQIHTVYSLDRVDAPLEWKDQGPGRAYGSLDLHVYHCCCYNVQCIDIFEGNVFSH